MKRPSFSAVFSILFLLCACGVSDEGPLAEELEQLDRTIAMMDEYVKAREKRISAIEDMLASPDVSLNQQYQMYGRLYDEYVAFQFDKAREVLECQENIALQIGDESLRRSATLEKAMLFTTAGMFLEAQTVFSQLDTAALDPAQKISWYNARQKFLHDYNEYVKTSGIVVEDVDKIRSYQDYILNNTPATSSLNRHVRVMRLIEDGRFEDAYEENMRIIATLGRDTRDYAVQTYWQGFICENLEMEEDVLRWWIESAMCDIRGAIKDNASLCSIAVNLIDPKDSDRAFRYIRLSLDDAVFYNAKLRKVQIASTLPWIEKAYSDAKEMQERDRNRYLMLTSVVALLLLLFAMFTTRLHFKQKRAAAMIEAQNVRLEESYRSIADAEEILRKTNLELVEANAAKEEYLGLFLSMCSGYLDKLKRTLPREQYDAELKNFYKTFDTSFLSLYPSFVEDFNSLLKMESRISVKEGEMLSTELRIFALIKLGITQSSHIASLLRYSVNTIYNYRAQVKNAALSERGDFEEKVRGIGSRR